MAMSNAMDSVDYGRTDYYFDANTSSVNAHPLWLTDKHVLFHLFKDESGTLGFIKTPAGDYLKSPRNLIDICSYRLVTDVQTLRKVHCDGSLPSNVHPKLLREAILQREPPAMEWLVSTWPSRTLRLLDVIPLEDFLEDDHLTAPFVWSHRNTCLMDCVTMGLLKLQPYSGLKRLDCKGFPKDRKLCRELCRLPILWMKPASRVVEDIHDKTSDIIDISKDKVQRCLNRISVVYQNIDDQLKHGNKIAPVEIALDLKITLDDVPLGLALQGDTPFSFSASHIWMKHLPEVTLLPCNLDKVMDLSNVTHFEDEDSSLSDNDDKFQSLIVLLSSLPNLRALSLPNCIDTNVNQEAASLLNTALHKLRHLQRLNFSYCNMKGKLSVLLGGLRQNLNYLNLKDCRLSEADLFFLVQWRPLLHLRELNLSCNDLGFLDQVVIALLERMVNLCVFSVSYCSLSVNSQNLISRECMEVNALRVVCMQSYVPMPEASIFGLLRTFAANLSIQKLLLFPEVYAFPGHNDQERSDNKIETLLSCYQYLDHRGRPDIELE